jgi:hypothetical protein
VHPTVARPLTSIRAALRRPGLRALVCGLALALFGAQLILQTHSVSHDLLPSSHQVCEHCVIAKAAAPPPAVASAVAPTASIVLLRATARHAAFSLAPLVERNRGPPSVT